MLQEKQDGRGGKEAKRDSSRRRVSWLKEGKVAPEEESSGSSESEVRRVPFVVSTLVWCVFFLFFFVRSFFFVIISFCIHVSGTAAVQNTSSLLYEL